MNGAVAVERVLVVDDDESMIKLLSSSLRSAGVQHDVALDGVEALHHLGARRYDVVVVDLEMPTMNGIELLSTMRRLILRPPLVVVITAHARRYIDELDESLVNVVVRKPFDPAEVVELIVGVGKG